MTKSVTNIRVFVVVIILVTLACGSSVTAPAPEQPVIEQPVAEEPAAEEEYHEEAPAEAEESSES